MSDDASDDPCNRCGQSEGHSWVEGDCVLPHRNHSRKLVEGTFVCRPCVNRHESWLTEITDLYATLTDVLYTDDAPANDEYQKPRKRPASPSPLRLQAWALLHPESIQSVVHTDDTRLRTDTADLEIAYLGANLPDIPALLANWAQAVYDVLEWTMTAPNTVSGAVAVLRGHSADVAGLPDVDGYDAELKWMRTALRQAHTLTDRKPVGRCPSLDGFGRQCKGPLWADEAGRMAVTCGKCRRHFDEPFLRHLGGMMSA